MTTRYADRLTMSTDNSIYQLLPDAVIFPRSTNDVAIIASLAADGHFASLAFTPRGGGTGTNGQALNQGIVVDMSRYMTGILDINVAEGWVKVEAGVVKDQLNAWLKPYGYFFFSRAVDQQSRYAWRHDQYRCLRTGVAGIR